MIDSIEAFWPSKALLVSLLTNNSLNSKIKLREFFFITRAKLMQSSCKSYANHIVFVDISFSSFKRYGRNEKFPIARQDIFS